MTITKNHIKTQNPRKLLKSSKTLITLQSTKNFDQDGHDHDFLVDLVDFPESGEMQISQILEQYNKPRSESESATLITWEYTILGVKPGVGVWKPVPKF